MRPSRLVIVGLAGLVALHVFMLAGHGHGDGPFAGMPDVAEHATSTTAPSLSAPMAGDEGGTGMELGMTVACLAVVAGLLLLQPRQRHRAATSRPDERPGTWSPAHTDPGRLRTRSLEELCISLT